MKFVKLENQLIFELVAISIVVTFIVACLLGIFVIIYDVLKIVGEVL